MIQICINGTFQPADQPVIQAGNRSYRYGNGLFETMKVSGEKILLETLHFERLFSGMTLLGMKIPVHLTAARLKNEILSLCGKNKAEKLARVRLSVYHGNGGLYDDPGPAGYLIESWPLEEGMNRLNENGLVTDIFPDARKSCDRYSTLKSSGFLPYALAAQYAKKNKLNDCFLLNTDGNLADSTIANIFLIREGRILTPALSEGCIAGVMRKHLIGQFQEHGMAVEETRIQIKDLLEADEIFLSNAIRGIRWVGRFREKQYGHEITRGLYERFIQTISY